MDDLQFYRTTRGCDNERLCAMEFCLRLNRTPPQAELEPGTTRSVGQSLAH